ncbi:unnamed protein product, partial [Nesidiocoris tenuis]
MIASTYYYGRHTTRPISTNSSASVQFLKVPGFQEWKTGHLLFGIHACGARSRDSREAQGLVVHLPAYFFQNLGSERRREEMGKTAICHSPGRHSPACSGWRSYCLYKRNLNFCTSYVKIDFKQCHTFLYQILQLPSARQTSCLLRTSAAIPQFDSPFLDTRIVQLRDSEAGRQGVSIDTRYYRQKSIDIAIISDQKYRYCRYYRYFYTWGKNSLGITREMNRAGRSQPPFRLNEADLSRSYNSIPSRRSKCSFDAMFDSSSQDSIAPVPYYSFTLVHPTSSSDGVLELHPPPPAVPCIRLAQSPPLSDVTPNPSTFIFRVKTAPHPSFWFILLRNQ